MHALNFGVDATLHGYSQVLFSCSRSVGMMLLLATMAMPEIGVAGLVGAICSWFFALCLGFDPTVIRSGSLTYNGMLLGLVLGSSFDLTGPLALLILGASLCTVLVHVSLSGALARHFALPTLTLPFVFCTWLALSAGNASHGLISRTETAWSIGADVLSDGTLRWVFSSLGAIFAEPSWVAGVLIAFALVRWSRIAAVHAACGYGVAAVLQGCLLAPNDLDPAVLGFNLALTSVALGGVFFVPGPASLGIALVGSAFCGLIAVGLQPILAQHGWPLLILPFNLAVLLSVYAIAQRPWNASPRPVDLIGSSPEESLHRYQTRTRRFRQTLPIRLRLPFKGTWICTQGNDGEHTHQDAWKHGLDFEIADTEGQRHGEDGSRLTDWHCFGQPVLAAAAGTVAEIVSDLPDLPVGEDDLENNWGNLVLLRHGLGLYSMVAHLQRGSVQVRVGDTVSAGQPIGRCGSSGRSPIPHLHFQLQATAAIGDATLPLAFHDIARLGADGPHSIPEYLPEEQDRVSNIGRDAEFAESLSFPAGSRWSFEVRSGESSWIEQVQSKVDLYGNRTLSCEDRGSRLWFDDRGDSFIAYDYIGPRDSALFALYCALSKVPLQGVAMRWTDNLNPRRLWASPITWLRDCLGSVLPMPEAAIALRGQLRAQDYVIHGHGRDIVTKATLSRTKGIQDLCVRIGTHQVEVRCVG